MSIGNAGPLYPKINSCWKRHPKTNRVLMGDFAQPEFGYLEHTRWHWWEKVDGTNIRLHWDGEKVVFGGRTNNAQIPAALYVHLMELVDGMAPVWAATFDGPTTIYGEGFGPGIQKVGSTYGGEPQFAMFDVRIEDWWLSWENVQGIAETLGLNTVPFLGETSLHQAINIVKNDIGNSSWPDAVREGLVGRPAVELRTRRGDRIITKVKRVDYQQKESN